MFPFALQNPLQRSSINNPNNHVYKNVEHHDLNLHPIGTTQYTREYLPQAHVINILVCKPGADGESGGK